MVTVQSKKYKHKEIRYGEPKDVNPIIAWRVSPVFKRLKRNFFRKDDGMYKPKPRYAEIVERAHYLQSNGHYPKIDD